MSSRPPAIVADSTISLPPSMVHGLPLLVAPFEVHHDGQVYADGEGLSRDEFYRLMRTSSALPTTSAPTPAAFLKAFQAAAQYSDEIICLTLSSELSAAFRAALLAKEEASQLFPGVTIHLVDTRTAGPAEGLVALEASRRAAGGASTAEVLATVEGLLQSVYLLAYLETLHYVWRSGRVPRVAMWLGRLLNVKPVLELTGGRISMLERPRTQRRAMDRIVALVRQRVRDKPCRITVMHADAPSEAADLADRVRREIAPVELFITEFTPVIGAHTGPGLVGCAFHVLAPDA